MGKNSPGYHKRYYAENGESIRARARQRHAERRDEMRQKGRERYRRCREKVIARTNAWAKANPEKRKLLTRGWHLRKRYGMTSQQFDQLLAKQEGKCAICRSPNPGGKGTWHIDHDHSCCGAGKSCGKCVRGLLCRNCNTAIGLFKENPTVLMNAIKYLEKP